MAEAVGRAAAALLHVDRMQLALDVVAPELEELVELGKIGRQVEFLPDETLEQGGMVGQPVDDLCRGEPIPPDLQLVSGHVRASRLGLPWGTSMARREFRRNRKARGITAH